MQGFRDLDDKNQCICEIIGNLNTLNKDQRRIFNKINTIKSKKERVALEKFFGKSF